MVGEPRTDLMWDAGDVGCGELVLELRGRLLEMPGRVLRVIAIDPGAPDDLPAWCRMTRHTLVHQDPETRSYWIRGRGEPISGRSSGEPEARPDDAGDIYGPELFRLAAALPPPSRLTSPHARAMAHSKLCGSQIEIDLDVSDARVAAYGQRVKACLLGRVSASVVASRIVGTSLDDLRRLSGDMRAMLREGGVGPGFPWEELRALQPVQALKGRHPSTLLVFDALDQAIGQLPDAGAATRDRR